MPAVEPPPVWGAPFGVLLGEVLLPGVVVPVPPGVVVPVVL